MINGGVDMLFNKIECPECETIINIPVLTDIDRKKLEDEFISYEESARKKLLHLESFLQNASLWDFIKIWCKRSR